MQTRKRSRAVGFSVFALSVSLAACGPSKPGQTGHIYTSIAACTADRPRAQCEEAWTAARAEHARNAEAFANLKDCQRQWGEGRCEQSHTDSRGSWFEPKMVGFMVAPALTALGSPCKTDDVGCPKSLFVSHVIYLGGSGGLYSDKQRIGAARPAGSGYVLPRAVALARENRIGPFLLR